MASNILNHEFLEVASLTTKCVSTVKDSRSGSGWRLACPSSLMDGLERLGPSSHYPHHPPPPPPPLTHACEPSRCAAPPVLGRCLLFSHSVVSDSVTPTDCSTPGLPVHCKVFLTGYFHFMKVCGVKMVVWG